MVAPKKTMTGISLGRSLTLLVFALSAYCFALTGSFVHAAESTFDHALTEASEIYAQERSNEPASEPTFGVSNEEDEEGAKAAHDRKLFVKAMEAQKTKSTLTSSLPPLYSPKFTPAKLGGTIPQIKDVGENGKGKGGLGVCEGDCDYDSDCGIGLMCFQRNGNEPVPGCSGSGKSGWDYCVAIKSLDSSRGDGKTGYGMCQGDCDKDSDCSGGLTCFQRDGYEPVPGCSGLGKKGWDYCTNIKEKALDSSRNGGTGYGMCEGDCDKDSDCKAGLKCFQREFFEPVPGCSGLGKIKWDYCVDEKFVVDKKNDLGSKAYGLCEGDCDKDSDCSSGLTCFQRDGDEPIPGCFGSGKKGWDYCVAVKPLDSSRNGGTGYGMCEGDCDYDSDCNAGLRCFQRDGNEPVPGCSGIGKTGWDYCYHATPPPPISPPTVLISNKAKRIADLQFDFGIKVEHSLCLGASCFSDDVTTNSNVQIARREPYDRNYGLKCQVYIRDSKSCTYENSGAHLPCLKWDNFRDRSKSHDLKKFLSLLDGNQQLKPGQYDIQYKCFWRTSASDDASAVASSSTGWKTLHSFRVIEDCADWLPSTMKGKSTIAQLFLSGSPEFLAAECTQLDIAKEAVFRAHDINPMDGKLSYDELLDGFTKHDMDTTYLKNLQKGNFFETTGVSLNDVVQSAATPLRCQDAISTKPDVYFTDITYPTHSTGKDECKVQKEIVEMKWDYNKKPSDGDFQCIYVDGRLYKKLKTESGKAPATKLEDIRPATRVGLNAMRLTTHLTFENGSYKNLVDGYGPSAAVAGTTLSTYGCGSGISCLKRTSSGGDYFMKNQPLMESSAIMTWIRIEEGSFSSSSVISSVAPIWFSEGPSKDSRYVKFFGIKRDSKTLYAKYFNEELSSSTALSYNRMHHVAMVLNKEYGFTLFLDGVPVASNSMARNSDIDFEVSTRAKVLGANAIYDDFRIFTGVITPLHVKAVFECGQSAACAALAYAEPQSRRTYCIIPNYAMQIKSRQVFACTTGLFFNGAAIDLQMIPDQKGILFSFRDTALSEIGFEVLRQLSSANSAGTPLYEPEAVVLIDSSVDGCASKFSPLSFFDDTAIKMPGDVWEYSIRTKFDYGGRNTSDPFAFTTPWFGVVEGSITAGKSAVPIRNVRVCARIKEDSAPSSTLEAGAKKRDLAAYTSVWHSNQDDIGVRSSAFKATDRDSVTRVTIRTDEWMNITLGKFSSISEINVCYDLGSLDSSRGDGETGYGICEGDCDKDSDCSGGLTCFQRDGYEPVPGCSGLGKKGWDYCTNIKEKALDSSRNGGTGYGMCEGDCDKDSDCKAGLKCFQREFFEPVPGCSGLGKIKWDYCVDEKFVVDKKNDLGSKAYGLCEGDCDKDSDCSSGLTCFQRDGDEPIPGCFGSGKKGWDYCVPKTMEKVDISVRLMDFPDPESDGEVGAQCVLNVNSKTGVPLTEQSGSATCQSYKCAGTATSTFLGQYITLKSQVGKIVTITEVEAMGVEIDCPYSAYTDDDGNFEIEVIDASGKPNRKTHIGILPYKTDIFDRTDVQIMVAKKDTNPEALLVALNIDKSGYNANYDAGYHRDARKLLDSTSLDSSGNGGDGATLGGFFGSSGLKNKGKNPSYKLGACQGDCDSDSDCKTGLKCFQRSGYTSVPGCKGLGKKNWDYCIVPSPPPPSPPPPSPPPPSPPPPSPPPPSPPPPSPPPPPPSPPPPSPPPPPPSPPPPSPPPPSPPPPSPPPPSPPPPSPPPPSPPPPHISDVDSNSDNVIDMMEFLSYCEERMKFVDVNTILSPDFWSTVDKDDDGELNAVEFHNAVRALDEGLIYGIPWLVFPAISTKDKSEFYALDSQKGGEKHALMSAIPSGSPSLPFTRSQWQYWYGNMSATTLPGFSLDYPTDISPRSKLAFLGNKSLPESHKYTIPVVTFAEKTKFALRNHIHDSERVSFTDATEGFGKELFPAASSSIELHAIEQFKDVVHMFDEKASESVHAAKHLGTVGADIEDTTAVKVTGMVRFPGTRTQKFICGLQFATIAGYKGVKCDFDETGCSPAGYKYESAPEIYSADELGVFDIAVTPGETWTFIATYDGHTICYGGENLDDYPCEYSDKMDPIKMYEESIGTNNIIELVGIQGGENLVFFDVTARTVDIGLYAGACGTPYTDYSLKITPANGCGATMIVRDKDIVGSTGSRYASDQWKLLNPEDESSNLRLWPYAAMDYYIQLEQAPDVSSLNQQAIEAANPGTDCKPPGTNIMQFFRDRNTLVQTMLLLERTLGEVKYVYHGWFCATPFFGRTPDSARTPFTSIRADEKCIGKNAAAKDLTINHLVGTSDQNSDVKTSSFYALKIFEAHLTSADKITYCSKFNQTINDAQTRLAVTVQFQQDVGPQGPSNPCHSSSEPSKLCSFNSVNETDGLLLYGSSLSSAYEISTQDAVPNLVPPHRRKVLARIQRNDGWAVTSLPIERELVTIATKIRGGGGNPNDRYISDTKFYATAPIKGLVYTVVHDPPGGNSFSSISKGTKIDLELGLVTTRAAEKASEWSFNAGATVELDAGIGFSAGSGYVNGEIEFDTNAGRIEGGGHGGYGVEGPSVTISAETDNGWDFHMTLDRNLESSQDPGLPGRPGDVILGGGFEIVYVRSDKVDLRDSDNSECLQVIQIIEWYPRKPTTYVMAVFSIEYKIIPELIDLIAVTENLTSIILDTDKSMKGKDDAYIRAAWKLRLQNALDDWKRTLEWSSPDFSPEGFNALSKADKEKTAKEIQTRFDQMSTPFNSDESVFGKISKPLIDSAFGAYTQEEGNEYTAKKDWDELSELWDSVPSDNAALHGIPKVRRTDAFAKIGGQEANAKAAGAGAAAGTLMMGPGIGTLIGAIAGGVIDRMANPNPEAYLDDTEKIIVEASGEEAHDPGGRWLPTKEDKWLSSYQPGGTDDGRNLFNSNEDDTNDGFWSRGMSSYAKEEMNKTFTIPSSMDEFFEDKKVSSMVDASVFGSEAQFGFTGNYNSVPAISIGEKQDVYLSFSGGGHNLEFTSSIESNIDSYGYSWSMEAEGSVSATGDFSVGLSFVEAEAELADSYGKSIGQDRAMAFAKYGEMEVAYTLGDGDPYDKFVIQVSNDKRFGTPVFKTIGGASKCPGEPNTMWREGGLIIETEWSAGADNNFIPPDRRALFDLVITNESPYRESHIYGLLLTSGEQYTGDFGGNMMDLSFSINGGDQLAPFHSLVPLHDVPSVDSNGDLKYTRLSLNVQKGQFSQKYTSVGVQLVSECEWEMSRDWLYRSPISSTAFLGDFKWERRCPKVDWDPNVLNRYLNYVMSKETSPYVNMTLMNPDPLNLWSKDIGNNNGATDHLVHPNVEFVRIQWRTLGVGEWINAWDMVGDDPNIWKRDVKDADAQCNSARGEGCNFKWNLQRQYFLNGLKDGSYEVRAKVFCSGYDSFATTDVKGSVTEENLNIIVDVSKPEPIEARMLHNRFTIDYSEPITCPQLQADHMAYAIKHVKKCDGTLIPSGGEDVDKNNVFFHYKFACVNKNSLMISFPFDAVQGTYEITVNADKLGSKVVDAGDNPAAKETFLTTFGCGDKLSGIGASDATTTSTSAALGSMSLMDANASSSSSPSSSMMFWKNMDSSGNTYLKLYSLVATVAALYALFITRTRSERGNYNWRNPFNILREDELRQRREVAETSYLMINKEDTSRIEKLSSSIEVKHNEGEPKTYGSVI